MKLSTNRAFGIRPSAWLMAAGLIFQFAPGDARADLSISDGNSTVTVNPTS